MKIKSKPVYLLLSTACFMIIICFLATSCERLPIKETFETAPKMPALEQAPPERAPEEAAEKEPEAADRLVIKRKTLKLEVKDVRKTRDKIDEIAARYNGNITSCIISSEGPYPPIYSEESSLPADKRGKALSATIVVKVPSDKFPLLIKDVKKLGEVEYEQESEEEVTQQYIDLSARLRNLKHQEERYLELLDVAKNVEEMLKVEAELSRVRGEIESLQARIDYLERSAKMATLTIELHEPSKIIQPPGFDWGFTKAITKAIQNFVAAVNFLIMAFGAILPFILLIIAAIWFYKFLGRRRQKRKKET